MNCPIHDADLLMMAHRELDGARAFQVRLHLLRCPACRARLRRYQALAGALAQTYRNPVLGIRSMAHVPQRAWAPLGMLAALLTLLGWVLTSNAAATNPPPAAPPTVSCPFHAARTFTPPIRICPMHRLKSVDSANFRG